MICMTSLGILGERCSCGVERQEYAPDEQAGVSLQVSLLVCSSYAWLENIQQSSNTGFPFETFTITTNAVDNATFYIRLPATTLFSWFVP